MKSHVHTKIDEIKLKIKRISREMQELEDLIKEEVNTPKENLTLNQSDKIQFPRGYIRRVSEFANDYQLRRMFVNNPEIIQNICYQLQYTDVTNYFMNRYNISLSAGKIFHKYAVISIVSVIESLLFGISDEINADCRNDGEVCCNAGRCDKYMKSTKSLRFNGMVDQLAEMLQIINEPAKVRLKQLKEIRDNIHSHIVNENELIDTDEKYTQDNFNKAILFLYYLKKNMPSKVEMFRKSRQNCNKSFVMPLLMAAEGSKST